MIGETPRLRYSCFVTRRIRLPRGSTSTRFYCRRPSRAPRSGAGQQYLRFDSAA